MDDPPQLADVAARLRDSLYTAVGLGVLGVQQAAVRGRDLRGELARLAGEVHERVDPVLDDAETRLPEDLRPLLVQGRAAARSLQRSLLGSPPR